MLHLVTVIQMVTSIGRTATLRKQLLLVRRFGQLTVVAYLKLLRVVISERLWAIPPRVPSVTAMTAAFPTQEISA